MISNGKFFFLTAAIWCVFLFPAELAATDSATPSRDWSAETASDLGKSLNRMQLLLNPGDHLSVDRSNSRYTAGDVSPDVSSFLTVVVGGVNTAMEGHQMGAGACHSRYRESLGAWRTPLCIGQFPSPLFRATHQAGAR